MYKPFDLYNIKLPIQEIIPEVKLHLTEFNKLILSADPGAGKSTILPLALLDEPWMSDKKIIMLEPRRLAASSIAHRMASLLGEKAGETIGYRIRFENQTSSLTRIEVVTEGILTRMLQHDNALENVGLIIFDEFHERRLHTELALMLCQETQQILRPDLRLIIMSATMDTTAISKYLDMKVIESKGQTYPVQLIHTTEADIRDVARECAKVIITAKDNHQGDILVFLPGEAEIRQCESLLKETSHDISIHPLYGKLSHREQQAAILTHPNGQRKVVLATAIAETSLTIEGINIVIDSGYTRTVEFDPSSGLSRLKTERISIDTANQRTGRAGRLRPGVCYRMWSTATHHRIPEFRKPEILTADLAPMLLDLAQWGIDDSSKMHWLSKPPVGNITQATETLIRLGALKNRKITKHGKLLNTLPCHPRIAHMLLCSTNFEQDRPVKALATDLAAVIEEHSEQQYESVDIALRISRLRKQRQTTIHHKNIQNLEKAAKSYRKLMNTNVDNGIYDEYQLGFLLAHAYPERIAQAQPDAIGLFKLANGRKALIDISDDLSHEPYIVIAQMDAREGVGRIFLAARLHKDDLQHFSTQTERTEWDTKQQSVISTIDTHIGSIRLKSEPIRHPLQEKLHDAWYYAVKKEGRQLLNFDQNTVQFQNRVTSLRTWNPEQNWPDLSTETLLAQPEAWLHPYLSTIKKTEDLYKIKLSDLFFHSLSYDQQQLLHQLAPTSITVPSGSSIKIDYNINGELPTIAVRLQEVFGMFESPRVNRGTKPIIMHLLSPGFKPVQVTTDLDSFWKSTYFEVRKELRRRYPKHAWPENPLQAEAVRGITRKK